MNIRELTTKIELHPRALMLQGTLEGRMKNSGSLPGLTPHYAMPGCPLVIYDGANAVEDPNAAELEFNFMETAFPLPAALQGYSAKQGNMVQVMFGRNGQAPTQAAYRVLREASAKIAPLLGSKRQVFAASLPILTPGQYGVTVGRHYLLGLFDSDGSPIWIHPDALAAGTLKTDFPADQQERSTAASAPKEAPAPAPANNPWYETMRVALASTGLKGKALHTAILNARAHQLVEQGAAPNSKAALALATADLPSPSDSPNPKPVSSTKVAGKGIMGRK